MGWFSSILRHGARVGAKVLGGFSSGAKALGEFANGAGKVLGSAAPHLHRAISFAGPLAGADGLVAAGHAHNAVTVGPALMHGIGHAAHGAAAGFQAASDRLARYGHG